MVFGAAAGEVGGVAGGLGFEGGAGRGGEFVAEKRDEAAPVKGGEVVVFPGAAVVVHEPERGGVGGVGEEFGHGGAGEVFAGVAAGEVAAPPGVEVVGGEGGEKGGATFLERGLVGVVAAGDGGGMADD